MENLRITSAPPTLSLYQQQQSQQQQQQHRPRRATKSDFGLRQSSSASLLSTNSNNSKLVLGQIPLSRKRQSTEERLNSAQWPSVLPLADRTIHRDNRCLDSMFKAQSALFLNGNCFLSVQTDVTAHHRHQAVEWLFDVCKEERCEADVFLLAVSLVDRFLSVHPIDRHNLQALAGVCLFVSSKVKAPQPLNAQRVAYYTDGAVRVDQIL
ncbi:unnamed protein product, partial [Gongylonema pulchrum]|uniref:Cyclin N-terminal domain-containing protein n=1 Tax=Gongylonema pulchrum TaxID=637853 RepID=A0A183EW71_9BILA